MLVFNLDSITCCYHLLAYFQKSIILVESLPFILFLFFTNVSFETIDYYLLKRMSLFMFIIFFTLVTSIHSLISLQAFTKLFSFPLTSIQCSVFHHQVSSLFVLFLCNHTSCFYLKMNYRNFTKKQKYIASRK